MKYSVQDFAFIGLGALRAQPSEQVLMYTTRLLEMNSGHITKKGISPVLGPLQTRF